MDAVLAGKAGADDASAGKVTAGKGAQMAFIPAPDSHMVGHPDADYAAKIKAKLSAKLSGDQVGQDTNADGTYASKSLAIGKGGRSEMMRDRITQELVDKGYNEQTAFNIAKKQVAKNAVNKYGTNVDWEATAKTGKPVDKAGNTITVAEPKPQPQPKPTTAGA